MGAELIAISAKPKFLFINFSPSSAYLYSLSRMYFTDMVVVESSIAVPKVLTRLSSASSVDGSMWMGQCGWVNVDGSMWMGRCGWVDVDEIQFL